MKKIMLLFLIIPFSIHAQYEETFDLRWKINDTLIYNTIVEDNVIAEEQTNEEVDSVLEASKAFFKELQDQIPELKYETRLYQDKNENIDITMFLYEIRRDTNNNIISDKPSGNRNVALRGKVSQEGELLSFFYKNTQSNLIALLFELPNKRVKIGDTWNLAVDLIQMDQNYIVDTFSQKNNVWLEKIQEKDGDKIAIIKYDIEQYTSGNFGDGLNSMLYGNNEEDVFMKVTYQAAGYFSITKGIWITYDGMMEIDTNFSLMGMDGKKQTAFKLIPELNKSL